MPSFLLQLAFLGQPDFKTPLRQFPKVGDLEEAQVLLWESRELTATGPSSNIRGDIQVKLSFLSKPASSVTWKGGTLSSNDYVLPKHKSWMTDQVLKKTRKHLLCWADLIFITVPRNSFSVYFRCRGLCRHLEPQCFFPSKGQHLDLCCIWWNRITVKIIIKKVF